jgi:putative DNA primase/helicase
MESWPNPETMQPRLPQAGEIWIVVEGPKDAAALHSLGYNALGKNTSKLNQKFATLLRGVNVVLVPDRDTAGVNGADDDARKLFGLAESVSIAALPAELKGSHGADVWDILALDGGEQLVRDAIANARPWTPLPAGTPLVNPESRTDEENGRRFAREHGELVRHVSTWGKDLSYDGKRWAVDDVLEIQGLAKKTNSKIWDETLAEVKNPGTPAALAATLLAFAKYTSSVHGTNNMLTKARSEPGIVLKHEKLDTDPWLFNVENGTIDLRTGQLRPHNKADQITKLCPIRHDPDAECPRWRKFASEIMAGDKELIGFLRRLAGYWLTGSVRDHVLPIFYGSGANGKSVFLNTLLSMLGPDYGMTAPADLLLAKKGSHPTELADLFGKRLVCSIEIESGRVLAESLVKALTGGENVRARRMREDFWEFRPSHKLAVAANHLPIVRGRDNGIWRRVALVPFNVKF